MAITGSASSRSQGQSEKLASSAHAGARERGVSLFSVNREGRVLWTSKRAYQELRRLNALDPSASLDACRLDDAWTCTVWSWVSETATSRWIQMGDHGETPVAGFLTWEPRRPDQVTVLFCGDSPAGSTVDPLWHDILIQMGSAADGSS